MYSYIDYSKLIITKEDQKQLEAKCRKYKDHIFNLLGSGHVKVCYGLNSKGFNGCKYDSNSDNLVKAIAKLKLKAKGCSVTYEPILWYTDFKSGFRFYPWKYNSKKKCQSIIGKAAGVDIKVPWELGRFYHLVQIAILSIQVDEQKKHELIQEFRDEIIDFLNMNPIGKTVQWSSSMDVSIRIVNFLMAYDILKQVDHSGILDKKFCREFEKHIYKSLKFLMDSLDYFGYSTSNHYLSNITGIIFASAYLPRNRWIDACFVFGIQELIDQVFRQFHLEGSNFEGSTSYHRLSAELVLFPTALVLGALKTDKIEAIQNYNSELVSRLKRKEEQSFTNEDKIFSESYINRIYNMGVFTQVLLKQNNEIVQIGDNDSGRLIKLSPTKGHEEENTLDHRTLLSAISGLYGQECFEGSSEIFPLEASMIRTICKDEAWKGKTYNTKIDHQFVSGLCEDEEMPFTKEHILYSDTKGTLLQNLQMFYYKQFGVVVLRGKRLFISMVIDTTEHIRLYGHTHNDMLSIELMIDEKYITRDPGNYVYSSAPELRDKFRSIKIHNCPHVNNVEQNIFSGLFNVRRRARARLQYCGKDGIIGVARYGRFRHKREIQLTDFSVIIRDYMNAPFVVDYYPSEYTIGYGEVRREHYDSK